MGIKTYRREGRLISLETFNAKVPENGLVSALLEQTRRLLGKRGYLDIEIDQIPNYRSRDLGRKAYAELVLSKEPDLPTKSKELGELYRFTGLDKEYGFTRNEDGLYLETTPLIEPKRSERINVSSPFWIKTRSVFTGSGNFYLASDIDSPMDYLIGVEDCLEKIEQEWNSKVAKGAESQGSEEMYRKHISLLGYSILGFVEAARDFGDKSAELKARDILKRFSGDSQYLMSLQS